MTVIGAHPDRLDLDVRAGEPVDFTIPVLDADGVAVTSLSGWTGTAQARGSVDGPVLHEFTITLGAATVQVTADPATTAAWAWPVAQWDLVLTSPTGVPHVLCAGWIRVYPTITH